jgi:hypothetical protein
MASEVSREVSAAVRWLIVGIAVGVVPTYVLLSERGKRESAAAAGAAASPAAASVYAAWSAAPKPTCPPPPIEVPTVVAVTGPAHARPTRIAPPKKDSDEIDDSKMLVPLMNMAQGMMSGNGSPPPDPSELLKNLPKTK